MKHLIYESDEKTYHSKAFDLCFGDLSTGSFDIETTGLSPARSYVILIGFMELSDEGCRLHQFFAENLSEEEDIIRAFLDVAKDTDVLLTYNGRTFDIPFMEKRMSMYPALADEKLRFYDLDMYTVISRFSPLKSFLPNLKQKTVESFLGLWTSREDEISGAESVDLYFRYLSDRDPETEELILCHNRDDVLQLARLMQVLRKTDFHKAMYDMGFPMKRLPGAPHDALPESIVVNKISITPQHLEVCGKQQYNGTTRMIFESGETPYTLGMDSVDMDFHASLPLVVHENMKNLFIADLRPLGIAEEPFAVYPQFSDGLLVLQNGNDIYYPQAVHFVREFLNKAIWNNK